MSDTGNIAADPGGADVAIAAPRSKRCCWKSKAPARASTSRRPTSFASVYDNREMHNRMRGHLATVPHIFNIVIADENGQVVASTAALADARHQRRRSRLLQDRTGAARRQTEHIGSDPQQDRWQPDRRLRPAPGNRRRRVRRHHLRQRELELLRGFLRVDAFHSRRDLQPRAVRTGRSCSVIRIAVGFAGKRLSHQATWAGRGRQRQQELPYSREGGQQLSLCVVATRSGISAVRQHLGHRERRAWRDGSGARR